MAGAWKDATSGAAARQHQSNLRKPRPHKPQQRNPRRCKNSRKVKGRGDEAVQRAIGLLSSSYFSVCLLPWMRKPLRPPEPHLTAHTVSSPRRKSRRCIHRVKGIWPLARTGRRVRLRSRKAMRDTRPKQVMSFRERSDRRANWRCDRFPFQPAGPGHLRSTRPAASMNMEMLMRGSAQALAVMTLSGKNRKDLDTKAKSLCAGGQKPAS